MRFIWVEGFDDGMYGVGLAGHSWVSFAKRILYGFV